MMGLMLRNICVENFPRFAKARSTLDAENVWERRTDRQVWDHAGLAVTMSLEEIDGKPACVMRSVVKRYDGADWAAYAVPIFGPTWESDQTVVEEGKSHVGDDWRQHIVVRFPTGQLFKFDADRRDDRLWSYTISLIAK